MRFVSTFTIVLTYTTVYYYEICKYFYNSSYLYYCILFLASVDRDYDVKAFKNKYIQYAGIHNHFPLRFTKKLQIEG